MSYLPELFEARDYATAIKVLDSMAEGAEGPALASMLCNRALCYQKMDLHRKALKNYDEAVRAYPTFARAHMGRGKALQALGRPAEAQDAWRAAIEGFSPADDLQLIEDAFTFVRNPEMSSSRLKQQHQMTTVAPPSQAQATPNGVAINRGAAQQHQQQVQQQPQAQQQIEQRLAKPKSSVPDASLAVGIAVSHINVGRVDEAVKLLDQVISSSKLPNMGALVARGTARALKRDLTGAIEDFTGSITIYPNYGDAWKRRGQARSADGDREGALKDFQRALELIADAHGEAEIRAERAMIYQKDRDLRRAVAELEMSLKLDDRNASAWNHLGLCRTGLGDIEDGCIAYRRAIALDPKLQDAWFNMAQARKEAAHVEEAEAAFKEAFKLLKSNQKSEHIRRVYSHMKQGMGEHMNAVRVLDEALEKAEGATMVECYFLRGACYHALGYHKNAIDDYSKAFLVHEDNLPEEIRQQQVLAFFQRELVTYAYNHLDNAVASFSLDRDIHPVFKELWCKKVPPNQSQLLACQVRHRANSQSSSSPLTPSKAETARLVAAADALGVLLQNYHQGFLPNKRQQRMGGLAAIELAQAVRQLLSARAAGEKVMVTGGATGNPQEHEFGWRDAMDIIVKWRQLSEPNDQVIWVDLLTEAEFEAGFGSHTPMFSGQTKCVRYYMNFHRALDLLKEILLTDGRAYTANNQPIPLGSAEKKEAIRKAKTAEEMWAAMGEDGWAVVPIQSSLHPGQTLEGTRLTIVKIPNMPDAYEMSIRTPVTPPRWRQYDQELSALWENVIEALQSGDKPMIAVAVLTYAYYWYNFMPLARGTAVCGYITILSLFAAAGMPITARIPKDYQVDWEAILNRSPSEFIASLSPWLLPPEARPSANGTLRTASNQDTASSTPASSRADEPQLLDRLATQIINGNVLDKGSKQAEAATGRAADAGLKGELKSLPAVKELIPTLRNRLEVLNGARLPRL